MKTTKKPQHSNGNKKANALPKKVAVLYTDDDPKYFETEDQHETVANAYDDAIGFEPYLKELNIETCYIKADSKMAAKLVKENPDLAINLVTTIKGYDYLGATVPGILELMDIPYTGTNLLGFTLGSNKYVIYALLSQNGIPVPRFQLLTKPNSRLDLHLRYPLILKLNEEHSNVEITMESVVENEKELRKRVKYLMKKYGQDVLVSEFIVGREFAAFFVESLNKQVYVNERIINIPGVDPRFQFMDYELVWKTNGQEYKDRLKHKKYHDPTLSAYIKKAFEVCRMDDYGKFDIRMDKQGKYYFIDANANCYLAPPYTKYDPEISKTVDMHGVPFSMLLKSLLQKAMLKKLGN